MRTVQDGYESLDERLGISGEYPCTERGRRITESAVTPPQWRRARLPVLHRSYQTIHSGEVIKNSHNHTELMIDETWWIRSTMYLLKRIRGRACD